LGYAVKEAFYTLQGEGARTGRAAVFCRFAGCNLWSGREEDRATAACRFCDTDFVGTDGQGGGKHATASQLAEHLRAIWDQSALGGRAYVVFTGGEPLLQIDPALVEACHRNGLEIAIETNGTIAAPPGIDWICVSPKPRSKLVQIEGHELKLVYPQLEPEMSPEHFEALSFDHFFLQPMDGPRRSENTQGVIEYVKRHPRWRLSLQTHKILGIP
jgi:7-carboxy-7-deazaguanine synthase